MNDAEGLITVFWILYVVVILGVSIFMIAAMWKLFSKAGLPGWGAIIPIYNTYLMLKVAGKPGWWLILYFIPVVNFVISIIVFVGVAENFGKGGGYAVGLIFLPIIFIPILAFGSAKYVGAGQRVPAT